MEFLIIFNTIISVTTLIYFASVIFNKGVRKSNFRQLKTRPIKVVKHAETLYTLYFDNGPSTQLQTRRVSIDTIFSTADYILKDKDAKFLYIEDSSPMDEHFKASIISALKNLNINGELVITDINNDPSDLSTKLNALAV
jgi:hypothetical protein